MKSHCIRRLCASLLLLCPSVIPCLAQDGAASAAAAFHSDVRLVEVYATIYDNSGHYVDGLSRDAFQVLEDGKPQEISIFETNAGSLSCAVLIDTTGSMTEALPRVKNSIIRLIDALGPGDSIAIYTFDRRLVTRQEFTTDKDAAKRAVLRTRAEGETALFDAIAQTAQDLTRRSGKKALVVFTDGEDNASTLNASSAVTRAKRLGIPLYTIAEGDATKSRSLRAVLDEMSRTTGGTAFQAHKAADIEKIFQDISSDLQHLYLLSYRPAPAQDDKWRKIEVAVKGVDGYRVRAKQGYFPN